MNPLTRFSTCLDHILVTNNDTDWNKALASNSSAFSSDGLVRELCSQHIVFLTMEYQCRPVTHLTWNNVSASVSWWLILSGNP